MTDDREPLTNEERNQKIEELREKRKARDQSDLRKVLDMKEGRRVMWRMFCLAGIADEIFDPVNSAMTDFNLGKRSVGLAFLRQTPPEIELVMKRESANDRLLNEQELKEVEG